MLLQGKKLLRHKLEKLRVIVNLRFQLGISVPLFYEYMKKPSQRIFSHKKLSDKLKDTLTSTRADQSFSDVSLTLIIMSKNIFF